MNMTKHYNNTKIYMEKNPHSKKRKEQEEEDEKKYVLFLLLSRDKLVEYGNKKKYKQHLVFG